MRTALLASTLLAVFMAGSRPADQAQFRSGTDIVEVHATVKLKDGTIARDLGVDDFELFEDGKRRDITVFSSSVQPLSIAMVLDHSGSTESEFSDVRLAAQEFVGRLLRADRTSIGTLMWDCQAFTDDSRALMTVLRMELPLDQGSPIWAATDRAMSSLASEGGRRVIVLFSDGVDTQGPFGPGIGPPPATALDKMINPCEFAAADGPRSIGDVIKRAERDAIMVYTVIVEPTGGISSGGSGNLTRLSLRSGAEARRLGAYSELRAAFRSIADELHLQYLLGFAPSKFDGKRHTIDVRAKRRGVTVRAREAYVADKAK